MKTFNHFVTSNFLLLHQIFRPFLPQIWQDPWNTESILYTVVQSPLSGALIDAHVTIQRYFPIANIQLITVGIYFPIEYSNVSHLSSYSLTDKCIQTKPYIIPQSLHYLYGQYIYSITCTVLCPHSKIQSHPFQLYTHFFFHFS